MSFVNSSYHNPHLGYTPHGTDRKADRQLEWNDLPLSEHDIDALRIRGITPEIAHARRYRSWTAADARRQGLTHNHACDTLAIPNYSPAGEFDDYLFRPHVAPIDPDTGKARRYQWRPSHRPSLGGPPAGTPDAEERAHRLRDDINVPVVVTESIMKGDSVLSHAETDVYTLAIHGTWNWTRNGAPRPELRDIEWRVRRHDRIVQRRLVVLVPDSDYAIKPEVAFAWWEFGQSLKRKNADVLIYHLPPSPDGSKLGPDDAIARGVVTVAQLVEDAVALPDELPEICRVETCDTDDQKDRRIVTLEADLAMSRRYGSLMAELAISPNYTPNEKVLLIRGAACAMTNGAHTSRPDGSVELDPGKISNDFRPTDKQHPDYETYKRSPVNPSGDPWLMRRSSVSATAKSLERKIGEIVPIRAVMDYRRAPGDPAPHRETMIVMDPPANMVDFLEAVTRYRPDGVTDRPYTTQPPCPHCGKVHERTVIRQTICGTENDPGCGAILDTKTVTLPVPPASRPFDELTDDQRDRLHETTASPVNRENVFTENMDSPPPHPVSAPLSGSVTTCSEKMCLRDGGAEIIDAETGEIVTLPLPPASHPEITNEQRDRLDHQTACLECGNPTSNTYRCDPCIDIVRLEVAS